MIGILLTIILLSFIIPTYAWSNGGYSTDPNIPPNKIYRIYNHYI